MYKFILFFLVSIFIIIISGCDEQPLGPSLGDNLFPLTVGNKFEYKMVDLDAEQKEIPETARNFTREIGYPVYVDGYLASPVYGTYFNIDNNIIGRDTLYVYKSPAEDTISYYMKIVVPLTDTSNLTINKWAPMFLRQYGSEYGYVFFDSTVKVTTVIDGIDYPMSLTVTLSNMTGSKTKIAVIENSNGYVTNRLSISYSIKQAGAIIRNGDFYKVWLAEHIGPVKETKYYLDRQTGTSIELTSKTILAR
jgi:hypothetical protein